MQGNNSTPSSQGKFFIGQEETNMQQISFPVVAIGAAAGGVKAICNFLDHLPAALDMAFIILLYSSSEDTGVSIKELLQKRTAMKVVEAAHNMRVEMNKVYLLPMENYLSIGQEQFIHLSLYRIHKDYHVIDHFFSTMASVYGNNAIAVVLSGSGADGTAGIRCVRSEGGIVFAQDDTASFRSMPQYAIESGNVDMVLPPEGIARELGAMRNFTFRKGLILWHLEKSKKELACIYQLLLEQHGVDFSMYKPSAVNRHIVRRMTLSKAPGADSYLKLLENDKEEVSRLYKDLLSGVSGFFMEPMLGRILQKKVFPSLFNDRKKDDPVRIWIPACSGGEEACTIAIYLLEYMYSRNLDIPIQIFATDLNEATIEAARSGFYTRAAIQHITPLRLRKFFTREEGGYRVIKPVRDVCIFATHNFLKDPPFARIDIISCQHMLKALELEARQKVLRTFHYALKSTGFFLLDRNDDLPASDPMFGRVSREFNIYVRKPELSETSFELFTAALNIPKREKQAIPSGVESNFAADKIMLAHYAPAGMLIDGNGQIVRFYGITSPYLRPQTGKATLELFRVIHEDLVVELRLLIHRAATEKTTVSKTGVPMKNGAATASIYMDVVPVSQQEETLFLLVIRQREQASGNITDHMPEDAYTKLLEHRVEELEVSLQEAGRQMRTMQDAFEEARQELQAAHEELLSNNEELQSINEELQTSKEELQATNEELKTMNEEVIQRNAELKESMEYSEAIVETIRQPLLDLYSDLRIRKANRAFYHFFQLRAEDVEENYLHDIADKLFDMQDLVSRLKIAIGRKIPFESLELVCKVPRTGERIILFSAARINGQPGKRARLLLVLEDITERRLMEMKKDEFISIASHELKTPATSIQAYTQILYNEFMEADDRRNALLVSKLNSQVHRLTSLTRDLLDTTNISRGQLGLKEDYFDLRSMAAEAVEELQLTTSHPLLLSGDQQPLIYWGDRERLTQALQNLITNAIKYSSEDEQIVINLERRGNDMTLSVHDFGIGMTQEVKERVFERFFRSRDPLTLKHPGLGLGLYIANQIVQRHDGQIIVDSEKDKGSVFTIVLPIRK